MKFFDPGRFLIGAIFLAFGLFMLHEAVIFECSFTPEPFSLHPMDFPRGVLILWCLLSILYILVPRKPVLFISLRHVAPRLFKTALAILFFILALRHAGFVLSGIFMLLVIFHALDFKNLKKGLPVAAFSIVLVWAVFVHLLQIPLPLALLFGGVLFGTLLGALPGLGSILALTVCLPFTLMLDHIPAFALMLGTYVGSLYGGSIASILINVPGTPQAAATNLDGYPMALAGKAAEALGWVTVSAVAGGLFSCLVLAVAAGPLAHLSNTYAGPLEICALIAMGLACITTLSEGNMLKGLFSALFGVLLSTAGMDPVSSELRFTFGFMGMASGIDMLPFIVGLFPLSEVFHRIYEIYTLPDYVVIQCKRIRFPSLREWFARRWVTLRSAFIGTFIGILPGTGASPAAFISYSMAREASAHPETFGTGSVEGIIAPEASHNAVTGGAMVPTLALGIPGDAETTLILATLTIHQITPGVRLMLDNPVMVHSIFFCCCSPMSC